MLATLYRRVSTDAQDNSLELQEQKAFDYARLKGLEILPDLIFGDEAVSGSKPLADRPGGRKLIATLTTGRSEPGQLAFITPVRHLIVTKLDRLGRNAENMLHIWRWAREHTITIHIVDLGGETITSQGYAGKLIFGILSLFAEFERELIRDRITQTLTKKFNNYELIGTLPYGYDLDRSRACESADGTSATLMDNPDEQRWLRQMAGWRACGWSFNRIARSLNDAGVPTKTGILGGWQTGNVKKVLHSKHTARLLSEAAGFTPP